MRRRGREQMRVCEGGAEAGSAEQARTGCSSVNTALASLEKETPTPPRRVLPALLERRVPWLLDPTRKTLVWGAPPVVSILLPLVLNGMDTLTDDFFRYMSLAIAPVGALTHSFLTVPLAAAWRTFRALDAENELDAWRLDGLKVFWALLALYLLCLPRTPGCTVVDLAFTAFLTVLTAYAASRASAGSSALLAGMLVLTVIRLHFPLPPRRLHAPRRRCHRTGRYHSGEGDGAPPAERARGGRGMRAREQRAEVWI
ncbi:hypothetical protein FB451DRAFT_1453377 [Mycena latifolia]|nr:hypothetical protein FB451DRAFT_1453377 [Mycena latifolia]